MLPAIARECALGPERPRCMEEKGIPPFVMAFAVIIAMLLLPAVLA